MVPSTTILKPPVHLIGLWQLVLLLTAFPAAVVLVDGASGICFAAGSLIQIAPAWWFTRQAWRFRGARQTRHLVRAMYIGESGKVFLSAALFALAFAVLEPLVLSAVFAGYLVMWLTQLLVTANLLGDGRGRRRQK